MSPAPGYTPHAVWWKDTILRTIGAPNVIKRLQMADIFAVLDLKPDEVALDFGCSGGYFTYEMAKHCRKAYGIDIQDVSKNLVPPELAGRLEFRRVRGEGTGFPDAMFDVILMSEVVPMIPEPREFFAEVSRILKPGGRIVLVNPLERRAIRREYERRTPGLLLRAMRALGRAPADYDDYTRRLQTTFGTALMKLPDERYYHDVLREFGFSVTKTAFTPSAAAQEAYERMQFACLCLGLPTFGPTHFVLYPGFKAVDRLRPGRRGTGCVMEARRSLDTRGAAAG